MSNGQIWFLNGVLEGYCNILEKETVSFEEKALIWDVFYQFLFATSFRVAYLDLALGIMIC